MSKYANKPMWIVASLAVLIATGCALHPEKEVEVREERTPLDEYVAEEEPHYEYTVHRTVEGEGYTGYIVHMVSQQWLTTAEVEEPFWWHWLHVAVPDDVEHDTALLFIGGGSNTGEPPTDVPSEIAQAAVLTNSIAAEIRQVPNQPLTFVDDPGGPRHEDWQIAYAWDQFLNTGDTRWPSRLPMTKSAVKAMDTVTDLVAQEDTGGHDVNSFTVAGASKRGWTTWTTAAVDDRVKAIIPAVIDLLNIGPSFIHHYSALGFWAPAVSDYEEMGIFEWLGTEENRELMRIVEPYNYRHRLTMPKYIVNSTGDQFFLPDSSQFYFGDLEGEKYLRYVPNTGHGLGGSDAREVMLAYYHTILTDADRPRFSWTINEDHSIRVEPEDEPETVTLWQATNPEARDFRKDVIGEAWEPTELAPGDEGSYLAEVPEPEEGWTAFMVELTYPGTEFAPLKFTTEVVVVPGELPYEHQIPDALPHADAIDWEPNPLPVTRHAGPPQDD
ncbi:MAG: PhoPQ-activated pathogenicity-related family protein [Candidatus Hydrogenedentota bacterium]